MSYRIYKPNKSNDYRFFDGVMAESYNVGGVDAYLYTFEGATGNAGSTDSTKPDLTKNTSLKVIGDSIFGETVNRKYNPEAIKLPVVYQIQEATPDLKLPGLFFNFNTMDITLHYNTMMQRVGRKIIPGDVLELPNLRDTDIYDSNVSMNKWYVVQDAFKAAEGYSATWNHHIWKLRVKPLTDSPEFSDLVDKIKDTYPSTSDDPNDTNPDNTDNSGIATGDKQLEMMNAIIQQADSEVPYMHWDNEHIYDDSVGAEYLKSPIPSGFSFPKIKNNGMYFKKLSTPVLYEKNGTEWVVLESKYGVRFPSKPKDGTFYFKVHDSVTDEVQYKLYQYELQDKQWYECLIPSTDVNQVPANATEFYYYYQSPVLYMYNGSEWTETDMSTIMKPFTSKDIAGNRTTHDDVRGGIPPVRGTVPEGDEFPSDPTDNMYFYRTDYTPARVWQYSADQNKWSLFPYGGRLPWVGPDQVQAEFVNSKNRVSIHDVVKPNIKQ